MSSEADYSRSLLPGLVVTIAASLLLLGGAWLFLALFGNSPLAVVLSAGLGLLAIFGYLAFALVRASRAERAQDSTDGVPSRASGHQGEQVSEQAHEAPEQAHDPASGATQRASQTQRTAGSAALSVLKFNDPYGADRVLIALQGLQEREMFTLQDAAVVSWPQGNKKPTTRQQHSTAGMGAMGGAFWGFLFGLIFFVPFLGAAIGAGMGALTGSMADVGISDDFIRQVREKVMPGTSALFAVTSGAPAPDKIVDELSQYEFEIISTNLPEQQERQLREAFAE